jgi:hypothetical protein
MKINKNLLTQKRVYEVMHLNGQICMKKKILKLLRARVYNNIFIQDLAPRFGDPHLEETDINKMRSLRMRTNLYGYLQEFQSPSFKINAADTLKKVWLLKSFPNFLSSQVYGYKNKSLQLLIDNITKTYCENKLREHNTTY